MSTNEYFRNYMRQARSEGRSYATYQKKAKDPDVQAARIAKRKADKAEYDKARRRQLRLDKPDKRTKEARPGLHYKQILAMNNPKPQPKPMKLVKLKTDRKPPKQAERIQTKAIPISECTPVYVKELRATIYVKPGQDIEQARQRYLSTRRKIV